MSDSTDVMDSVTALETELSLKPEFVRRLLSDDDWSFVVKTHAVLESTLTLLLVQVLSLAAIEEEIALVDMNVKLKMMSKLDIFSSQQRGAMRALSKLRNRVVHNADQLGFAFSGQGPAWQEHFVTDFGYVWPEKMRVGGSEITNAEFAKGNPKLTIWVGLVYLLGEAHIELEKKKLSHDKANFDKQHLAKLIELVNTIGKTLPAASVEAQADGAS